MKRFLLLLTLFGSLTVMGQTRQRSYTFDFSKPESLYLLDETTNPGHPFLRNDILHAVKDAGSSIVVNQYRFFSEDSLVVLSFDKSHSTIGAEIVTDYAINNYIPYLSFARFMKLITSSTCDGINLLSFRVPATDRPSGLVIESTDPASVGQWVLDDPQLWYGWYNTNPFSIYELVLRNDANASASIHQIIIDYELERDMLVPAETGLEGAELNSFQSVDLIFKQNMTITEDAVCTLTDDQGNTYQLSATVNGKVITLSLPDELTTPGNYTLTVQGGSFADMEDFRNSTLTYHFTIVEPVNTFNLVDSDPAEGKVEELPVEIVLTFPGNIGFVDSERPNSGKAVVKNLDGEIKKYCIASKQDDTHALLKFVDEAPITANEPGLYTLVIPEGLVYNINYDGQAADKGVSEGARYNKETVLTFIVGDEEYPSAETMADAVELLAYEGVGYPSENSAARTDLQALVDGRKGSDAEFKAAMDAFYAETDVTLPITGEYYRISAVSEVGNRVYLAYDGQAVTLTPDETQAAAFKAQLNGDNTVTLKTLDGKFLHQLSSSNVYEGTSMSNITTEYSALVNNLKLQRFVIEGYSSKVTFGLFSIFGSLGKNAAGININAYALVNVAHASVVTDPTLALAYFQTTLTNAFEFETFDKSQLPVPDAEYILNPASGYEVDYLSQVTVTFPAIDEVTLADASKIHLETYTGSNINPASVALAADKTNEFVISFDEIPAGPYKLVIEKGAFTYLYEQTTVKVQTITASYTVRMGVDFIYDFDTSLDQPVYDKHDWKSYTPIHDVDINEVTFFSEYTPIKVNPYSKLTLKNYNSLEFIGEGVFIETTDPDLPTAKGVIKLKLDEPIVYNGIPTALYVLDIPAATFGDVNFGKYINGDPSVKKSDCHVNDSKRYYLNVDNAAADATVGIDFVQLLRGAGQVYDLQGRKVEGTLRPGIYVKNGRKFVVK